MSAKEKLMVGIKQIGLNLSCDSLLTYLDLLHKWNKAYNLTAVRDLDSMISRHLLDSLAILPWLNGTKILDVGTGPGLPGIPIALARSDIDITLLDSNGKKTRFLHEVKRALSLDNVEIVQTRVESYHKAGGFDTVVSRAFSDLQQMVTWTRHLIAKHGIWLAMKGRSPDSELAVLQSPYKVHTYSVPGIEGERCCVIIEHKE
jgi:16S rRNA (guanine527-N7)-methyltransferase